METGTYQATKDVAMRTGISAWMLMEGGKIEVTQIDKDRQKALWVIRWASGAVSSDWMHFSRYKKCFKRIGPLKDESGQPPEDDHES